jgi:thymidylate synthase
MIKTGLLSKRSKPEMHSLTINDKIFTATSWDEIYKTYLKEVLTNGEIFVGRNGETRSVFGSSVKVDLRLGFPLASLRKLPFKNIIREFLFDIGTDTNVDALGPAKHFWSFLADDNGWLWASAYNRGWRQWPASRPGSEIPNETLVTEGVVDQLSRVSHLLCDTPNSRHGTIITHNPTAQNVGCPPCHPMMQLMPSNGWLDMMVPARSNDLIIGHILDVPRYAIILTVMAKMVGLTPRYLAMPGANTHIYKNCYEGAEEIISRASHTDPILGVADREFSGWDDIEFDDFSLTAYNPHPPIKFGIN